MGELTRNSPSATSTRYCIWEFPVLLSSVRLISTNHTQVQTGFSLAPANQPVWAFHLNTTVVWHVPVNDCSSGNRMQQTDLAKAERGLFFLLRFVQLGFVQVEPLVLCRTCFAYTRQNFVGVTLSPGSNNEALSASLSALTYSRLGVGGEGPCSLT